MNKRNETSFINMSEATGAANSDEGLSIFGGLYRFSDQVNLGSINYNTRARLRRLHPHLEGLALTEIRRDRIDKIMARKAHRRPGTINHYLATVREILRKTCREWGG